MEKDEYVNIQAEATDNVSMRRVDFYVDTEKIASTTVAPFNQKWVISMTNIIPIPGRIVTTTEWYSDVTTGFAGERMITVTQVISTSDGLTLTQVFSNGMSIISDTLGITETHVINVVAIDAAGNETQSDKVRIWVAHKPKDEKKETEGAPAPTTGLPVTEAAPGADRRTQVVGWVGPPAVGRGLPRPRAPDSG
jgi:hypothetical protein